MRRVTIFAASLVLALAAALVIAPPGLPEEQTCERGDESTEAVLPGVVLTWDSSFLSADGPDSGSYTLTVSVTNSGGSSEGVSIDDLELTHTTPRPRGQGPEATASASGLPVTVSPGETESFGVSGTYELVETDEGKKANLHFQASGEGSESAESFALGINAHVIAAGAQESGSARCLGLPL